MPTAIPRRARRGVLTTAVPRRGVLGALLFALLVGGVPPGASGQSPVLPSPAPTAENPIVRSARTASPAAASGSG
jgi:hypothetical protein